MDNKLLGGLDAHRFLARHWQKRPLLVREAIPGFRGVLSSGELLALACEEAVASRLVTRTRGRWHMERGPFAAGFWRRVKARHWTLLVQDVNHFVPAAHALLRRFDFVPHARLDDVMMSYATHGGGVGAHFDSYDVFLLQAQGRRRWRISAQRDRHLVPGAPLKILARFRPEREWVLEPGDMLYLPPGYAHEGVALDECMTCSIGFRAPAWRELRAEFLAYLQERMQDSGLYEDPNLRPADRPGGIARHMLREVREKLRDIRWNDADVLRFLGSYLTEPKPHVVFSAPQRSLAPAAFARRAALEGIALDPKSRMLYAGTLVFINGECEAAPAAQRSRLRRLADTWMLRLSASEDLDPALLERLHRWYRCGYLRIGTSALAE